MIVLKSIVSMLLMFSLFHPVHVALTTIDIDEKSNHLNIVFKFDFESFNYIILHNYLYELKINTKSLAEKDKIFINDYIHKNFSIKVNDNKAKLSFNRHEIEKDEIWLYYNAEINNTIDSILVRNLLLLDVNLNQTNVVIIKTSNFEKGYILNKDDNIINISLAAQKNEI